MSTRFQEALPFAMSLAVLPVVWLAATHGGWTIFLVPLSTWGLFSLLDTFGGIAPTLDPDTPEEELFWHRAVVAFWPFAQTLMIFGTLALVAGHPTHTLLEKLGIFIGVGVVTGTIGIVYAHELMHQPARFERWLGDILMCMALYGHFRSEHLLVHHRYVGTPKDAVTARYNEHFWRFYPRVLWQSLASSWQAEKAMLARRNLPVWHRTNPFWRYIAIDLALLALAYAIGGWEGVALFLVQAGFAIFQLELVNYIEHYGLTRKHLGDGQYEHVKPRHSWNANHRMTSWLLINLQRHSDHHSKPARRYPLLQDYSEDDAPMLPHSYPVMTIMALYPPVWLRTMNPRVRAWRKAHYPEIADWRPYTTMSNPLPR